MISLVRKFGCPKTKMSPQSQNKTYMAKKKGQGPKTGIPVRLGPKTGTYQNQVKNATHEPCHWPKAHCTCFWPDKAQVHPSCLLCLTFNCFLSFFSQSKRPSVFPPYAPHTNADVRGDPLHPPHPTPRHTSYIRICLSACFAAAARSSWR